MLWGESREVPGYDCYRTSCKFCSNWSKWVSNQIMRLWYWNNVTQFWDFRLFQWLICYVFGRKGAAKSSIVIMRVRFSISFSDELFWASSYDKLEAKLRRISQKRFDTFFSFCLPRTFVCDDLLKVFPCHLNPSFAPYTAHPFLKFPVNTEIHLGGIKKTIDEHVRKVWC